MVTVAIVLLSIFNLLLGAITLARNPHKLQNISFFIFTSLIAIWIAANYFESATNNNFLAIALVKTDFAVGALLSASFLFFAASVSGRLAKLKSIVVGIAIANATLALLVYYNTVFTFQVVADGIKVEDAMFGALYDPIVLLSLALSIALLVYYRVKSRGIERQRASLILYGLFITVAWVVAANIVAPKVTSDILLQTNLQRLAYSGFLIFNVMVSYAIVRHRLFDIRVLIARSVTYLLSVITIGALYAYFAFAFVDKFFTAAGAKAAVPRQFTNAALVVILALSFQPIKRFFQKITDRIFYRDHYEAQLLINDIGKFLASEIELAPISRHLIKSITSEMRLEFANVIVFGDDINSIYFSAGHTRGMMAVEAQDLDKLGHTIMVADDLSDGEHKRIMNHYGIAVSVALRVHNRQIGYLLLGDKLSGNAYTSRDTRVVRIIANEFSVAVDNAKAYAEIQRFNETLKDKVTDATRKLRKANEDLKSLDQAKDEFISMASHQLRTPLTTAKGYVSMVLDGDFGKVNSKMQSPLEQALDSSNRMAGLINDLLNVSRMDAGKFFIDATQVDLDFEVKGELNQLTNLAKAKQVTVNYHGPSKKLPLMNLDLDKTRQVIMNLIDNAIFYSASAKGGGKVDVYLDQTGNNIEFRVVDNGIGVPNAVKPKLFAKFYRASNAQSARPDGTGLGLYLVKRVVEDQGGQIIFESQEGKGSTFGFTMPVANHIKVDKAAAKRLQQP